MILELENILMSPMHLNLSSRLPPPPPPVDDCDYPAHKVKNEMDQDDGHKIPKSRTVVKQPNPLDRQGGHSPDPKITQPRGEQYRECGERSEYGNQVG
jgi:hypothetical protein